VAEQWQFLGGFLPNKVDTIQVEGAPDFVSNLESTGALVVEGGGGEIPLKPQKIAFEESLGWDRRTWWKSGRDT
jgi:hypothetical protein